MNNEIDIKNRSRIKEELRSILEAFLEYKPAQELFMAQAKANGYKGNDPVKAKATLFTVGSQEEIGFTNPDITVLFERFQVLRSGKFYLKTIFESMDADIVFDETPEEDAAIVALMYDIKEGKEITPDEVISRLDLRNEKD